MAVNIQIYSNGNSASKSITFNFVEDVLAPKDASATISPEASYYFRVTTSAKQTNNVAFPVKIVRGLDELVLNRQKQRIVNTANAYSTIKEMVVDYTYDFINGHAANLYGSSCTVQRSMKFS